MDNESIMGKAVDVLPVFGYPPAAEFVANGAAESWIEKWSAGALFA